MRRLVMSGVTVRPGARAPSGIVRLPGSKSLSNRALIMAALALGETRITGLSPGDDTRLLIEALEALGVRLTEAGDTVVVEGQDGRFSPRQVELNLGNAGTSLRFLAALALLMPGSTITLDGSARMRERPIGDLVEALRQLGARIEYGGLEGCPPIRIETGVPCPGGEVIVRAGVSSQFLSALLLIGPALARGLSITVPGGIVSESYTELTIDQMRRRGGRPERFGESFEVPPGHYEGGEVVVEGDASAAVYFWALAAAGLGSVRTLGIGRESIQPDLGILELLERMGCTVLAGSAWVEVVGPEQLTAITADMSRMPDGALAMAALGAVAAGRTVLTGLSTLRHKESDRLKVLAANLRTLGLPTEVRGDAIAITGGKLRAGRVLAAGDHRQAMAMAVLGVRTAVLIDDGGVVTKSHPSFWADLAGCGVEVSHRA